MRINILTLALLLLLATLTLPTHADNFDWPQWRGPDRTDVSLEKNLLQAWPDTGPKQRWLFRNAGLGYAGPAIVDGNLYTMGTRGDKEILIALDADTGEEKWTADIGPLLDNNWGDGPRGTPAVSAGRVYAMGGQGTLICVNLADHKILWSRSMSDLGGKLPKWGYTESVLVDNDKVLCTPGGPNGTVAALNPKTGELLWQSKELTDAAQYSSIIAAEHNEVRQYIALTMTTLAGFNAADGKLLWQSPWPGKTAVIPTPIFHAGHVYITSGYGVGSKLIKLGPNHEVTDVYANNVMKNHHGGVILLNDHLYGYSDGVGWTCQNFLTGELVWAEKAALGKGAIAYADGRLYCLEESTGTLVLIEAAPTGWKEHGRLRLDPQTTIRSPSGRIWTHPVIANGKLYLRDQDLIYCYDVKR